MKAREKASANQRELRPILRCFVTQLDKWSQALAGFLNTKINRYSVKKQRSFLFLFCIVCLFASTTVTVQSLQRRNNISVAVSTIHLPLLQPHERRQAHGSFPERAQIHHYKIYLDSMRRAMTRTHFLDSLLNASPHLVDTLRYLDKLYLDQQNKSHEK